MSISIHAPRAGSDAKRPPPRARRCPFQSTLPVRGATGGKYCIEERSANFNPRSPCGERRKETAPPSRELDHFNPRSPCGERLPRRRLTQEFMSISIHAPRAGSDARIACIVKWFFKFQSTLPVRGATGAQRTVAGQFRNFNPRSPCGERLDGVELDEKGEIFQSTLPVRGATTARQELLCLAVIFQSTLPVRGATAFCVDIRGAQKISIHAPRAGSDITRPQTIDATGNFNPRSPCGERLTKYFDWFIVTLISIHAPRAGSDDIRHIRAPKKHNFNPRSPCGERRSTGLINRLSKIFQSTLPVRGATATPCKGGVFAPISIHAPRAGSDI